MLSCATVPTHRNCTACLIRIFLAFFSLGTSPSPNFPYVSTCGWFVRAFERADAVAGTPIRDRPNFAASRRMSLKLQARTPPPSVCPSAMLVLFVGRTANCFQFLQRRRHCTQSGTFSGRAAGHAGRSGMTCAILRCQGGSNEVKLNTCLVLGQGE